MARDIGSLTSSEVYPQLRRCSAMFEATIAASAGQPPLVAQKVLEIV